MIVIYLEVGVVDVVDLKVDIANLEEDMVNLEMSMGHQEVSSFTLIHDNHIN